MPDKPLVVYTGQDAATLAERWDRDERPFDLLVVSDADDVVETVHERDVDCVVVDGGDDPLGLLTTLRADLPSLPVVVFGEGIEPGAALEAGATHVVDAGRERIPLLESLASLVEGHRRDRRERTMLDSLLSNIPLSVYFKDRESRYVRISDAMLTMTGTDYIENAEGKRYNAPEDVVGISEFDLFPPGPAEEAVADDRGVVETEESIDNKIEHVYGSVLDGTYVATSKAPWYDERGNVVGTLGVTRDVSERKQYEHRLERQNERLDRFAQVVSHDLRNPLEVARGRLELARETGDDDHFDAIDRSLTRMDALIDNVLTLARQGETVSDPQSVSIEAVATDAWDLVESGGAELVVDTDLTVMADAGRLGRLFENLFRNAVEHCGQEALTVTIRDVDGANGFVVADDGVGIPEDERERIFEAGYTTGGDGAGLGLNIVQTIADAHGWHVSVHESADGGAAFKFEVPAGTE